MLSISSSSFFHNVFKMLLSHGCQNLGLCDIELRWLLTMSKSTTCENPFPNKPWFLRVCSTSLLKTLWEKGKLLVKEQFLLFPVFSTRFWNFLPLSSNLKLSSSNSFSLEESKICCLGKG